MSKNPKNWLKWLILTEKSTYLLKDLRNFNEVFGNDVIYDDIKSQRNIRPSPHSRRCILGKTTGEGWVSLSQDFNF